VATHANPCGAATTWVVSDNTWHVICFGFLGDLFSSFIIEIVLRHRTQSDFDDLNAQGCAFSGLTVATHHLGDQIPQNPHLGAWIGFFRPNVQKILKPAYYENYCIDYNQILHNTKDHHMLIVGGPNTVQTNPRWRTAAISEKS